MITVLRATTINGLQEIMVDCSTELPDDKQGRMFGEMIIAVANQAHERNVFDEAEIATLIKAVGQYSLDVSSTSTLLNVANYGLEQPNNPALGVCSQLIVDSLSSNRESAEQAALLAIRMESRPFRYWMGRDPIPSSMPNIVSVSGVTSSRSTGGLLVEVRARTPLLAGYPTRD